MSEDQQNNGGGSDVDRLAKMYPSMVQDPPEQEAQNNTLATGGADHSRALQQEPKKAEETQETETEEPEERKPSMYDAEGTYRDALRGNMRSLMESTDLTEDDVKDMVKNASEIFAELEVDSNEATQFHALYCQQLKEPATLETVEQWGTEAMERITRHYGETEAQERLSIAKQYIASNPNLQETLNLTGLGNHPDIVEAMVERAYRLVKSGKVKLQ